MQVSAIGINNTGFKGYDDDFIDVPYTEVPSQRNRDDAFDSVDFKKVAKTLDNSGASKVTSPCKFFFASLAVALAAFAATRAACSGAFTKIDNKFGMFENLGKKAGKALTQYIENHPQKEGKGFKIYCSNKARDFAQGIIEYGKKNLVPDAIKGLDDTQLTAAAAGQAIKKGTSAILGVGAAGATIESRYKDSDKNGVPDKAEGAMSTIKEVAQLVPALVDAAGI